MAKRKEFDLEEIKDLYLNKGYSISEIAKLKECDKNTIRCFVKRNNIIKKEEQRKRERLEKVKKTCLEKYNCENPSQNEEIKERRKKTCLEKYDCENPFQNENIKEKIKQTNLKKYNNENPMQSKKIKEKFEKTMIKKYKCKIPLQNEKIKEKFKRTLIKKGIMIDRSLIFNLINEGEVAREISNKLKCHRSLISRIAEKNNLLIKKNIATEHLEIIDFIVNKLGYGKK